MPSFFKNETFLSLDLGTELVAGRRPQLFMLSTGSCNRDDAPIRYYVRVGKEDSLVTLSISGTVSAQPVYTPPPASAPAATQQAPRSQPSADAVTLSLSAQVSQLRIQGQGPSQIAEALGIPVSTVDSDLGIVATSVASQPAPAQPAT